MENIFEFLKQKDKCYCVTVAFIQFKSKGSGFSTRDYCINILKNDLTKKEIKEFGFYNNNEGYEDVLIRNLSEIEISEFKRLQDYFVKVIHNEHGRVYELKEKSFKEYYAKFKNTSAKSI